MGAVRRHLRRYVRPRPGHRRPRAHTVFLEFARELAVRLAEAWPEDHRVVAPYDSRHLAASAASGFGTLAPDEVLHSTITRYASRPSGASSTPSGAPCPPMWRD